LPKCLRKSCANVFVCICAVMCRWGAPSAAVAVLVGTEKDRGEQLLRAYTATFPGELIDESENADAIVSAIHTQAHKVTPEPQRFLEDLDRFIWIQDEWSGSLSMYAGYCIARLTRESGVTVTLHGQGGDEILSLLAVVLPSSATSLEEWKLDEN